MPGSFFRFLRTARIRNGPVMIRTHRFDLVGPDPAGPDPVGPVDAETTASLARRLSIVILPFLNLSENAADDYLVDGIVNNLITSLSRALPGR